MMAADARDRTTGPGTAAPWLVPLEAMDRAIEARNATGAVRAWRQAYAVALAEPGWRGVVEVAVACLRIGAIPGFAKAASGRAREAYWTALFRARQERALSGVLHVAGAFGALGDPAMVEQCIRVAEALAARNGAAQAGDWVRTLAADLAQRYADAAGGGPG